MSKQRATAQVQPVSTAKPKLNPEAKAAICAQLRSGEYKKSTWCSYYRDIDTGVEGFDVDGVIRNTYALVTNASERTRTKILEGLMSVTMWKKYQKWLGCDTAMYLLPVGKRKDGTPIRLVDVNDGITTRALSFAKIADLIEKRL